MILFNKQITKSCSQTTKDRFPPAEALYIFVANSVFVYMPKFVLDISIYMRQTTPADYFSVSFFRDRQRVRVYSWSILLEIHSLYTLYTISRSRSFTESSRRQNASRSCLCYKTAPGTGFS